MLTEGLASLSVEPRETTLAVVEVAEAQQSICKKRTRSEPSGRVDLPGVSREPLLRTASRIQRLFGARMTSSFRIFIVS